MTVEKMDLREALFDGLRVAREDSMEAWRRI